MERNTTNGSVFFKVVAILAIVGGVLELILSILSYVAGVVLRPDLISDNPDYEIGMFFVSATVLLVASIVQFASGVAGIKNYKKPEKANVCVAFGIAVVMLNAVSAIVFTITDQNGIDVAAISLVIALVLPVLYVIGAFKMATFNKKSIA